VSVPATPANPASPLTIRHSPFATHHSPFAPRPFATARWSCPLARPAHNHRFKSRPRNHPASAPAPRGACSGPQDIRQDKAAVLRCPRNEPLPNKRPSPAGRLLASDAPRGLVSVPATPANPLFATHHSPFAVDPSNLAHRTTPGVLPSGDAAATINSAARTARAPASSPGRFLIPLRPVRDRARDAPPQGPLRRFPSRP
jgi:hypothetical protein